MEMAAFRARLAKAGGRQSMGRAGYRLANGTSGVDSSAVIDLTLDDSEQSDYDDHDDYVLVEIASNPITARHVDILEGGHWLNDEIINAYLHILGKKYDDVAMLSTFVHAKMLKEGPESEAVLKCFKGLLPLERWRLLLVPVNVSNSHWTLVAYDVAKRELAYYDSMLHRPSAMKLLARYKVLFTRLTQSLECEDSEGESSLEIESGPGDLSDLLAQLQLNKEDQADIRLRVPEGQPRQTDGSSCGVFLCKWAETLASQDQAAFTQHQVTGYRKTILDRVLSYKQK